MIKKVLKDLINNGEITICKDNICWVNKYRYNSYTFNYEIYLCLLQSYVIDENSGNWETGENHYNLNITDNRLFKINWLIHNIKDYLYFGKEIKDLLIIMKIKEERLLKMKKLN